MAAQFTERNMVPPPFEGSSMPGSAPYTIDAFVHHTIDD